MGIADFEHRSPGGRLAEGGIDEIGRHTMRPKMGVAVEDTADYEPSRGPGPARRAEHRGHEWGDLVESGTD